MTIECLDYQNLQRMRKFEAIQNKWKALYEKRTCKKAKDRHWEWCHSTEYRHADLEWEDWKGSQGAAALRDYTMSG